MTELPNRVTEVNVKSNHKPGNIPDYLLWLKATLKCDFDKKSEVIYRNNLNIAKDTILQDTFVPELIKEFPIWESEYFSNTGADLFMVAPTMDLSTKPFKSVIDKSFRFNVLWNKKFPVEPQKYGWTTPDNIYSNINDLVRTCLVCKFIDGPDFLIKKLQEFSKTRGRACKTYSQSREEGYYAHHFYTYFQVTIVDSEWTEKTTNMSLEIQVTTQLQDVLNVTPTSATGSVTFKDGSKVLGTAALSNGSASLTINNLAVGSHNIAAVYSGDTNDSSSTSGGVTETVNKANTTITLNSSANPGSSKNPVTFTAMVSASSATGTVTFKNGGATLGTATLSNGVASFSTKLFAGNYLITAVYGGDSNFNGSTSNAITQTIK